MLLDTLSLPLSRAIEAPGVQPDWQLLQPRATEPLGNGIYAIGPGAASQMVLVLPYALGGPLSTFSMRLYGWRVLGESNAANSVVWLPLLLAELACTAGTATGPSGTGRLLLEDQSLCDTLALTAGEAGFYGAVGSPGAGLIGWARLDLQGCQKIQFDFRTGTAPGNALWAKVSSF